MRAKYLVHPAFHLPASSPAFAAAVGIEFDAMAAKLDAYLRYRAAEARHASEAEAANREAFERELSDLADCLGGEH